MDGPNPMNPCLPLTQSTYGVYDVPVSTMTSQLCAQNRRFHANWRVSRYQTQNWGPMTIFSVTRRQVLRYLASRPVMERAATKTIRASPKLARSSSAQSSRKPRRSPGRLIRTITQMFFSHTVFFWKYFTHLHVSLRGSKLSWVILTGHLLLRFTGADRVWSFLQETHHGWDIANVNFTTTSYTHYTK